MQTCHNRYSAKKAANLVRECLPLPPSPINIPCPLESLIILWILHNYIIASLKRTMFMD